MSLSSSSVSRLPVSSFNPFKTSAASDEPPPRPAPEGILLCSLISAPTPATPAPATPTPVPTNRLPSFLFPNSLKKAVAALYARLSTSVPCSVSSPLTASSQVTAKFILPVSFKDISRSSCRPIVCMIISTVWYPFSCIPVISRARFIFA